MKHKSSTTKSRDGARPLLEPLADLVVGLRERFDKATALVGDLLEDLDKTEAVAGDLRIQLAGGLRIETTARLRAFELIENDQVCVLELLSQVQNFSPDMIQAIWSTFDEEGSPRKIFVEKTLIEAKRVLVQANIFALLEAVTPRIVSDGWPAFKKEFVGIKWAQGDSIAIEPVIRCGNVELEFAPARWLSRWREVFPQEPSYPDEPRRMDPLSAGVMLTWVDAALSGQEARFLSQVIVELRRAAYLEGAFTAKRVAKVLQSESAKRSGRIGGTARHLKSAAIEKWLNTCPKAVLLQQRPVREIANELVFSLPVDLRTAFENPGRVLERLLHKIRDASKSARTSRP